MMQPNELQQRFNRIEQAIHQAAHACELPSGVPMDVKDCVQKMDQQTGQARQAMQSLDESLIREYVNKLEQMSDRATYACRQAAKVDKRLQAAVIQAHHELAELKKACIDF